MDRKRRARRLRDRMDELTLRHRARPARMWAVELRRLETRLYMITAYRFQEELNARRGIHEAAYIPRVLLPP